MSRSITAPPAKPITDRQGYTDLISAVDDAVERLDRAAHDAGPSDYWRLREEADELNDVSEALYGLVAIPEALAKQLDKYLHDREFEYGINEQAGKQKEVQALLDALYPFLNG